MNLDNIGIVGIGAIIGVVFGFWAQIKSLLSSIGSIFVVSIELPRNSILSEAVAANLRDNWRFFRLGNHLCQGGFEYIRTLRSRDLVGFEMIFESSALFLRKWRFIFSSVDSKGQTNYKLSFIRGTLNYRKFIQDSVTYYSSLRNGSITSRFYIQVHSGSRKSSVLSGGEGGSSMTTSRNSHCFGVAGSYAGDGGYGLAITHETKDLGFLSICAGLKHIGISSDLHGPIEEICTWVKNKKWYEDHGVPWKLGWVLHGKPGTGKTSLIRGLGEELNLPIHSLDMATFSNADFREKWYSIAAHGPCIILIEDIDAIFEGRKNITDEDSSKGVTFDCLLNCIDGVQPSGGVFLAITTNHIEKMDTALASETPTRPGRIDRVVELKEMDAESRTKIASHILDDHPELIPQVVRDGEGESGAVFVSRCRTLALREFKKSWTNPDSKAKESKKEEVLVESSNG